jgi:hypothetical protein
MLLGWGGLVIREAKLDLPSERHFLQKGTKDNTIQHIKGTKGAGVIKPVTRQRVQGQSVDFFH